MNVVVRQTSQTQTTESDNQVYSSQYCVVGAASVNVVRVSIVVVRVNIVVVSSQYGQESVVSIVVVSIVIVSIVVVSIEVSIVVVSIVVVSMAKSQ